jgi:ferredoxin
MHAMKNHKYQSYQDMMQQQMLYQRQQMESLRDAQMRQLTKCIHCGKPADECEGNR